MSGGDTDSDVELWSRLALVEEEAFREVFSRHADAVYNYAFRRTSAWAVAEDVTQATFTRLWQRARSGRLDPLRLDTARPILLAMAREECRNAGRSARRQLQLLDRVGSHLPATTADATAAWVEAEAAMAQVRAALAVLPARQRDVVELVAWSGLTLAEAAAALQVPVGTVKSRLSRARQTLAQSGAAELLGVEA